MTICDKINEVGETLQENLNDRGVSCTFGTGTGESTVLEMVEMVNGTNFKGSSDVNLKIGANRPYLLTGETTDVVVKLEDGLCEPLKNKNVTIEQSVFRDNGTTTSHNDHYWTLSSYGTITRQTNDTKILNTSGTNSYIGYYVVPMDKTINETNTYSFNAPCIIEFDITDTSNTTVTNCNFQIYSNTTSDYIMEDITTSRIGHWKIIWGETEQKVYVDDTLIGTYNKTLTNARITFRARNNYYLCFKNLKIYKTINGVTDEKGEFALYDVSVTDDTTFTASYGTETATCLVEYCTFVDYGITSKHNDNWVNNNSNITVTRNDKYTTLTPTVNSSQNRYDVPTVPNQPFVIEFDKQNTSVRGSYLLIGNNSIQFSSSFSGRLANAKHLKFTIQDDKITCEHDGVVEQTQLDITSLTYIRFQINNTDDGNIIQYKDFRIR